VLTAYMLFASVVYADSFRLRLEDFTTLRIDTLNRKALANQR
jgi:hypothetical protein